MSGDPSGAVVRRFYEELWNEWKLDTASEIVIVDMRFRGSLGSDLVGREQFLRYVEQVRDAFPDWHNRIDEIIVSGNRVVTRMTWTGCTRFTGRSPADRRARRVLRRRPVSTREGRDRGGVGRRRYPEALAGTRQARRSAVTTFTAMGQRPSSRLS
jgi:hypothetical protein